FADRATLLATDAGSLYVHPEDRVRLKECLLRRDVVRAYAVELRRADGRHIWAELNLRVVRETSGPVTWEGALNDITERRLAEEALWDSERRLRLMVEQMPAVLWSVDPGLRFTLLLGAGLAAIGLKPNELVGRALEDALGEEDRQGTIAAAHRRALSGESVSFHAPFRGRWFDAHVEPYQDVHGRTTGVLGIGLDVTERHEAEEALAGTLSMLQSTLDAREDGILVLDHSGRVTTFNRRFGELWGLPPHVMASRDKDAFLAAALQKVEAPEAFLERVGLLRPQPDAVERSRVRLRDGRVLERSVLPQRLDGRTVGHVLSFREVGRHG
ncbi:MAG TPA: PAS domain S-box protein, partial [Vicinamibacteria bacterium]|nr:PAS domain S-box protein [Vicinamibacteria bacterium]